jgi:hypothetical protein
MERNPVRRSGMESDDMAMRRRIREVKKRFPVKGDGVSARLAFGQTNQLANI